MEWIIAIIVLFLISQNGGLGGILPVGNSASTNTATNTPTSTPYNPPNPPVNTNPVSAPIATNPPICPAWGCGGHPPIIKFSGVPSPIASHPLMTAGILTRMSTL